MEKGWNKFDRGWQRVAEENRQYWKFGSDGLVSTELSYFLRKSSEDLETGNKGVHPGLLFGQAKKE